MFAFITNLISLIANLCILFMTAYTLYLTVFSRKLKFVSIGQSFNAFYGDSFSVFLENRSLHAIPVRRVFLLKKLGGHFCKIDMVSFDDPMIVEARHIAKIETSPFTSIEGLDSLVQIHMDAVLGVVVGEEILWVKPYKKAPLRAAKRSFRKNNFDILTVSRREYAGKVLAENVQYAIHIRVKGADGESKVHTLFASGSGMLSEAINGYNAVKPKHCKTAADLRHHLVEVFGVEKKDLAVEEIERIF